MLIEDISYSEPRVVEQICEGNVFRHCEFSNFVIEGGHIDGVFLNCNFTNVDWYWGIFNGCVFVEVHFVRCTFRGTSFPGCKFVDCNFLDCYFVDDNLKRGCSAEGARVYGGSAKGCTGAALLFPDT